MDPNIQPNLGPIPATNTPTASPNSGSNKGRFLLYLFLLLVGISLAFGGYVLGLTFGSKASDLTEKAEDGSNFLSGFIKAQDAIATGSEFVTKSSVQIVYSGTITATDPGKSWTIHKGEKSITLTNQSNEPVQYYRALSLTGPNQNIESGEVKIGDTVTVVSWIDPTTGDTKISGIIVLFKAESEASPSAPQ